MSGNNNQSVDNIKQDLIDSIPSQCRSIASNFFNCVETDLNKKLNGNSFSYEDAEHYLSTKTIPSCTSKFNLEDCLKKYSHI